MNTLAADTMIAAIIREVLPHIRPNLADFGRIRRVSRHLAAIPAVITPTQIYSGLTTLVSVESINDTKIRLTHNGAGRELDVFRVTAWIGPSLFIEFNNKLYMIDRRDRWLFRALGYKILSAFNEYNPLCSFYARRESTSKNFYGSIVKMMETGAAVYIGTAGVVVMDKHHRRQYTLTHTRLRFYTAGLVPLMPPNT